VTLEILWQVVSGKVASGAEVDDHQLDEALHVSEGYQLEQEPSDREVLDSL
jgi:hypothetical protein